MIEYSFEYFIPRTTRMHSCIFGLQRLFHGRKWLYFCAPKCPQMPSNAPKFYISTSSQFFTMKETSHLKKWSKVQQVESFQLSKSVSTFTVSSKLCLLYSICHWVLICTLRCKLSCFFFILASNFWTIFFQVNFRHEGGILAQKGIRGQLKFIKRAIQNCHQNFILVTGRLLKSPVQTMRYKIWSRGSS